MAEYKSLVKKIAISPDKKTKQKEYLKKGKIPIIDQGQILIGGYSNDDGKTVKCELPVIVFGDHTRVVKYVSFPFGAGADGIKVLQPKEGVLPRYLFYGTQYIVSKMPDRGYARHYQYVEKEELPIPSIVKQQRIVDYIETMLSKLDESVETLKKTKQQLSVYRQAVIEATIAEGKRNTDCVHLFSDFVKKYQNGISKRKGVGVPTIVLRLADIESQNIKNNGDFRTIDLSENEREKYLINEQELLIIRVNGSAENVGRIIVVSEDKKYAVCDHFIRCTLDDTRIVPEYVKLHFNSMQTRKFINNNMVSTAGQNTISQTTLNNIQLFVPNVEKQQQLLEMAEERISICNSIEKTVDYTLQQAEALRQSILKQAFEGAI